MATMEVPEEDIIKLCTPHPNGTADILPMIDGDQVRFQWGNSLMLTGTPEATQAQHLMGVTITMSAKSIRALKMLPNTLVRKRS
jgi:hypothetical protein